MFRNEVVKKRSDNVICAHCVWYILTRLDGCVGVRVRGWVVG